MKNLNNLINEIRGLENKDVLIFGQPVKLDDRLENEELLIDIVDILEDLKEFEISDYIIEEYNENMDEYEEIEINSTGEYLDYYNNLGELEEVKSDNSYNYGGYFNHEINFNMYKNNHTNDILVELKVHKFGDVRGNYTDTVLLEFQNDYQFLEVIAQQKNVTFEYEDLDYNISFGGISEEMEIFEGFGNGSTVGYLYGMQDIKEVIENMGDLV